MTRKIKISCNYLLELKELLENKNIDLDYFKMPPYPNEHDVINSIKEASLVCPILLHGIGIDLGDLCNPEFRKIVDIDTLKQILSSCANEYISTHIFTQTKSLSDEEVFSAMKNNVKWLVKTFNFPIALENEPICPGFDIRECVVQPNYISRIVKETDSTFLLDIAHAKVAAYYLNIPLNEYLESLPLERVFEIHVSGTGFFPEGVFTDTHLSLEDEDYLILKNILPKTLCRLISIEFCPKDDDKNITQEIIEQVNNIKLLVEHNF